VVIGKWNSIVHSSVLVVSFELKSVKFIRLRLTKGKQFVQSVLPFSLTEILFGSWLIFTVEFSFNNMICFLLAFCQLTLFNPFCVAFLYLFHANVNLN
jgi:hypothetical protein